MEITQILILILLFKPQKVTIPTCHTSPPPVSPNTLCNFRNNLSHNLKFNTTTYPSYPKYFHSTPIPTTFSPSKELSPPSSPILSLPPLDLTPPTQNISESDISNDFLHPNYGDTDDDYGIPFDGHPPDPW